jgi:adenylate cyclase
VTIADCHPDVTVLFANLVGFSALTTVIAPDQVVKFLNEIFSTFDQLVEKRNLEKIKTIGDAYLVAGGVLVSRSDHVEAVLELALAMEQEIARFNSQYNTSIRLRIGISTGPIVAGVIGRKQLAYDLWGDTVNVATRLGSHGETGRIAVAESTYQRLNSKYHFQRKEGLSNETRSHVTAYELSD